MKWVFATNQGSIESAGDDYERLIRAAVRSAVENTSLQPFMIYDGAETRFTKELADSGVTIIQHRLSFYDFVKKYQEDKFPGNRHYLQIASGAFLRVDLPMIFTRDDYIIYTDCDVLFLKDPCIDQIRPENFACAPERNRGDRKNINTGVMLMNLRNLRESYRPFCQFIKEEYGNLVSFDQGAYLKYYDNKHEMLPDELNWKPYWGLNKNAQIIHFHGPKPQLALRFLSSMDVSVPPLIHEIFNENPQAYRLYIKQWAGVHARSLLGAQTTHTEDELVQAKRTCIAHKSEPFDLADSPEFVRVMLELNKRVSVCEERLEGNLCYRDNTDPAVLGRVLPVNDVDHVKKRINLVRVAQQSMIMLEIGLNAGHSALLCLMANPNLVLVAVDIFHHRYTKEAVDFLIETFPGRFHYIRGDSREALPQMLLEQPEQRFDAIHIDGGHTEGVSYADLCNSLRLARPGALIVLDDTQAAGPAKALETAMLRGLVYRRVDDSFCPTSLHAVVRVRRGALEQFGA